MSRSSPGKGLKYHTQISFCMNPDWHIDVFPFSSGWRLLEVHGDFQALPCHGSQEPRGTSSVSGSRRRHRRHLPGSQHQSAALLRRDHDDAAREPGGEWKQRLTLCDLVKQILSTLVQVMACCLTAPSHCLNQYWLIISELLWHSPDGCIMGNAQDTCPWYGFENYCFRVTAASFRGQRFQTYLSGANAETRILWWKVGQYHGCLCPGSLCHQVIGNQSIIGSLSSILTVHAWIILCMRPANERRRYIVTSSLIGWAHTQIDSCLRPDFVYAPSQWETTVTL